MTADEFKKRWKVGDKIRFAGGVRPVKITAIGESKFLGCTHAGSEDYYYMDDDYIPYEEPKKTKLVSPIAIWDQPSGRFGMKTGKVVLKNIDHIDSSSFSAELWFEVSSGEE